VSGDDLPSIFRTWTARRFLRQVQPLIEQVQGTVAADWTEAERTSAGPTVAAFRPPEPQPKLLASHTLASDLFVLTLVVSAIVGLATAHATSEVWNRVNTGLTVVLLAGAVMVLLQHSRGLLGRGMQRVAVASMLLSGITFYVQTFTVAFVTGVRTGAGSSVTPLLHPFVVAHQATYALELLLGFISAVITLRGTYNDDADIIKD
jgi:hypothetical protein